MPIAIGHFWLRFYIKNAAKTRPMAAFFEENAAIVIRQSVVQMKGGDLWLRFHYRNAAIGLFWLRFLRKRSYRSAPFVSTTLNLRSIAAFSYTNAAI